MFGFSFVLLEYFLFLDKNPFVSIVSLVIFLGTVIHEGTKRRHQAK